MRRTLILLGAVAACAVALPASAQVVGGGIGGSVGGSLGVGVPSTSGMTDRLGDTMREGDRFARDRARDGRDTARDARRARASANANADANGGASAGSRGASADFDLSAGAMVHGSDGAMLGTLVQTTRNTAGQTQGFLVRSADGTVRSVPVGGASVDGQVLVTGWTSSQFNRAPEARQGQAGDRSRGNRDIQAPPENQ